MLSLILLLPLTGRSVRLGRSSTNCISSSQIFHGLVLMPDVKLKKVHKYWEDGDECARSSLTPGWSQPPHKRDSFWLLVLAISLFFGGVTSCSSTPDTSTRTAKSKLILPRVPLYRTGLMWSPCYGCQNTRHTNSECSTSSYIFLIMKIHQQHSRPFFVTVGEHCVVIWTLIGVRSPSCRPWLFYRCWPPCFKQCLPKNTWIGIIKKKRSCILQI